MNWVTTNIRFPEDLYLELKAEAVKRRTSLAHVIREKVSKRKLKKKKSTKQFLKELKEIAKENDRQNPRISFSEKLIEMRYEQ